MPQIWLFLLQYSAYYIYLKYNCQPLCALTSSSVCKPVLIVLQNCQLFIYAVTHVPPNKVEPLKKTYWLPSPNWPVSRPGAGKQRHRQGCQAISSQTIYPMTLLHVASSKSPINWSHCPADRKRAWLSTCLDVGGDFYSVLFKSTSIPFNFAKCTKKLEAWNYFHRKAVWTWH